MLTYYQYFSKVLWRHPPEGNLSQNASILDKSLKITNSRLRSYLPEANGLMTSISISTLRPEQNGLYHIDGVHKCIFLFVKNIVAFFVRISLKFVHKDLINNKSSLI